jgi:hypothetical protein
MEPIRKPEPVQSRPVRRRNDLQSPTDGRWCVFQQRPEHETRVWDRSASMLSLVCSFLSLSRCA